MTGEFQSDDVSQNHDLLNYKKKHKIHKGFSGIRDDEPMICQDKVFENRPYQHGLMFRECPDVSPLKLVGWPFTSQVGTRHNKSWT